MLQLKFKYYGARAEYHAFMMNLLDKISVKSKIVNKLYFYHFGKVADCVNWMHKH